MADFTASQTDFGSAKNTGQSKLRRKRTVIGFSSFQYTMKNNLKRLETCLSYSPAISACLVFSSSPPFISLIHFRFGRCHQLAPIRHGFKPQSHTHPLPDCSLPSPMRDI
ncbi:hypothetical protein LDENG_00069170 [Lucifuga dentata]|nr:hypothetical protein LDENG_00069170 [Lucifuga dentata]